MVYSAKTVILARCQYAKPHFEEDGGPIPTYAVMEFTHFD